jgi:AMMECR1 domain-containing protein
MNPVFVFKTSTDGEVISFKNSQIKRIRFDHSSGDFHFVFFDIPVKGNVRRRNTVMFDYGKYMVEFVKSTKQNKMWFRIKVKNPTPKKTSTLVTLSTDGEKYTAFDFVIKRKRFDPSTGDYHLVFNDVPLKGRARINGVLHFDTVFLVEYLGNKGGKMKMRVTRPKLLISEHSTSGGLGWNLKAGRRFSRMGLTKDDLDTLLVNRTIKPGDLILFEGFSGEDWLVQKGSGSKFTHVTIVMEKDGDFYLLGADAQKPGDMWMDLRTKRTKIDGVMAISIYRILKFPGNVFLRSLKEVVPEFNSFLLKFYDQTHMYRFETNFWKLLNAGLKIVKTKNCDKYGDDGDGQFFCSEYIVYLFKHFGFLSLNEQTCNVLYDPGDVAKILPEVYTKPKKIAKQKGGFTMGKFNGFEATKDMCEYAFFSLEKALGVSPKREFVAPDIWKSISSSIFVTIYKKVSNQYQLRGCIGTFYTMDVLEKQRRDRMESSINIFSDIPKYTLKAAFEDSRFSKVQKGELKRLKITISLLRGFELVSPTIYDWNKEDGLKVTFSFNGHSMSATYLPGVASRIIDEGKKKKDVLNMLIKKGSGGKAQTIDDVIKLDVKRYGASTATMSYSEYVH